MDIIFGKWQPTEKLRWVKRQGEKVLQQQCFCWEARPGPLSTILPVRVFEWRDVETEFEEPKLGVVK